jgi:hypothetical protein
MAKNTQRNFLCGIQLKASPALGFLLILCVLLPGLSGAQGPSSATDVLNPERLIENLMAPHFQQMALNDIRPVIANLAQRYGNDPEFIELLKLIKLEAFGTFSSPYVARAVRQGDSRAVQVDLSFIGMTKGFSTFIAAERLLPSSSSSDHVRYMEDWKASVVEVAAINAVTQAGLTSPAFDIWDNYNDSQLLKSLLDKYRDEVYQDILAWVILHEVAHHYLGHLDSDPTSDYDSRQREAAADLWAFRTMQDLAYPVGTVLEFLALQKQIELAIFGRKEEGGTHPSWGARHDMMTAAVKPRLELPVRTLTAVVESTNIETGGQFLTDLHLWFINDPETNGISIGSIITDDAFQILSMTNGQNQRTRYLYGRTTQGGSIRITLRNVNTDFPEIEIQDYAPDASAPYAYGRGFYTSFKENKAMQVFPGLSVGEILNLTPTKMLRDSLATIAAPSEIVRAVTDISLETMHSKQALLLRMHQARISQKELEAGLLQAEQTHDARLREVMGADMYQRWQSAYLRQDVVQFGLSTLLKIERDPTAGTIDLFSRFRGHRADLDLPHRIYDLKLRSDAEADLKRETLDAVMVRYHLFNRKMFNKDPDPGFLNDYELQNIQGNYVVLDKASGLMWQRGGSLYPMLIAEISDFVRLINQESYAGHCDWRLPTAEEVLTLNEPEYYRNQLHIQPLFDDRQTCIWTADGMGRYVFALDLPIGFLHMYEDSEPCYIRAVRRAGN